MNKEKMFETIEGLDENFIDEAEKYFVKKKRVSWICSVTLAASMLFAVCVFALGNSKENRIGLTLQAQAAEIGKEYIHFGATMPRIINVHDDVVIMYDYVGLWVYDLKNMQLVGFCDFRPINMTQIQGDPCVFVEASPEGDYVRFYMNDGSRKYLYNVKENTYKEVNEYDLDIIFSPCMVISQDKQLSTYAETYILKDGTYVSYILDIKDETREPRYGDLVIVIEKDGVKNMYRPFVYDTDEVVLEGTANDSFIQ